MTASTSARADTRHQIAAAAARLLQAHGPGAVTTRGVAQAAGVQAPTIYRLFGDKDGLLDAVAEHVMALFVATKSAAAHTAAAEDVDPVADLRDGWETYLDFGLANPTLFALLADPARRPHSPAAQSGAHVLAQRVHRVALTGRLQVSETRAVDLIHAAGTGAVLTLLATPPAHRDRGLATALLDAVLHHVLRDTPETPSPDHLAAAVTLRALTPQLTALSTAERRLLTEWLDRITDPH